MQDVLEKILVKLEGLETGQNKTNQRLDNQQEQMTRMNQKLDDLQNQMNCLFDLQHSHIASLLERMGKHSKEVKSELTHIKKTQTKQDDILQLLSIRSIEQEAKIKYMK